MPFTPIKTPAIIKKLFPKYIWDVSSSKKVIYLTFDDGPTPEITHWVLNILKQYNAKASFFCIGNNIKKYPEIFQNILKEGHTIGNHTHNHIKGWKTKAKDYLEDINKAQIVIDSEILKTDVKNINLFRPPYGQITPKQGKKISALGYKIIMWDVLSFDWDKDTEKETCLKHILNKTTKGSIVVFHDSIKASKNLQYALPKTLKHFTELGYTFQALK